MVMSAPGRALARGMRWWFRGVLGLVGQAAWENDWRRVRVAVLAAGVWGLAAARRAGTVLTAAG